MNIDIHRTLSELQTKLNSRDLHAAFSLSTKLRSQLIGVIYEEEFGFGNRESELPANIAQGEVSGEIVTLTINEPLPSMKELTASMQDYWLELIHIAIEKALQGQKLPYFNKAFVWIEITTPKYSDNAMLWDTSNRAINLIINNLKGTFFEDDNHEHMAFGVVGKWGEEGKTVVKIMSFERFKELISN